MEEVVSQRDGLISDMLEIGLREKVLDILSKYKYCKIFIINSPEDLKKDIDKNEDAVAELSSIWGNTIELKSLVINRSTLNRSACTLLKGYKMACLHSINENVVNELKDKCYLYYKKIEDIDFNDSDFTGFEHYYGGDSDFLEKFNNRDSEIRIQVYKNFKKDRDIQKGYLSIAEKNLEEAKSKLTKEELLLVEIDE